MFKLSVPISTKTINKDNREIYLKQIREAGVDRIFLCGVGEPVEEIPERIVENVRFFKDNGYEVGIWLASIGHGFVLIGAADAEEKFSQIETIKGEKMHHANCPMDAEFRTYFAQFVAKLAKTGADIIMLDDDFRMSQREEDVSCACPLHLKRIGEILGEDITREKLFPSVEILNQSAALLQPEMLLFQGKLCKTCGFLPHPPSVRTGHLSQRERQGGAPTPVQQEES